MQTPYASCASARPSASTEAVVTREHICILVARSESGSKDNETVLNWTCLSESLFPAVCKRQFDLNRPRRISTTPCKERKKPQTHSCHVVLQEVLLILHRIPVNSSARLHQYPSPAIHRTHCTRSMTVL